MIRRQITRIAVLLLLSASLFAADQTTPKPSLALNAPQAREWTLISHYHYLERAYLPTVVLPRMSEPPVGYNFAEQVLISQFSARDSLDYDWWLGTWDDVAEKKLSDRMEASKKTRKDWRDEAAKTGAVRVVLTRWLLTGDYVILVYKVVPASADEKTEMAAQEAATAFHLFNAKWRATLDLENDPVMQHFNDATTQFERVVRPQQ